MWTKNVSSYKIENVNVGGSVRVSIAPARGAFKPQLEKLFANPEAAAAEGTFATQFLHYCYFTYANFWLISSVMRFFAKSLH